MDKKEKVAKWLASVIENGEPYDDYDKMEWEEFAGGEKFADAFRELADQIISIMLPQDKPPLLTLDEAKPYCKTAKTRYASGWTDTYIWDALGLIKAQREADIKFYTGN